MRIYAVPLSGHILAKAAEFFIKNEIDLTKAILVFPTQRSKLYFGYLLSNLSEKSAIILPNMYEVSEFYEEVTLFDQNGILLNDLQRNLLLKEAIGNIKEDLTPLFREKYLLGSFLEFASIGEKLLRFYDEIILEGIGFDSLKREGLYTDIEAHIHILETILTEYKRLLGERGLIDPVIKQAKAHINIDFLRQFNALYFIGAISMTKSEGLIFQRIDNLIPVNIFFHTDRSLIRQHKVILERFGLKEDDIIWLSKEVFKPRFLEIKAFSNPTSQVGFIVKAISDSINQGINPDQIAIVLPDESLKNAILGFIPEGSLNLTMGLDIKHSLIYGFLHDFLRILLSEKDFCLYYKDLLTFLKNPIIKNVHFEDRPIKGDIDCLIDTILEKNLIYVPYQLLTQFAPRLFEFILSEKENLEKITNLYDFCNSIERLIKTIPRYLEGSGILDHYHQRCALDNILKRIRGFSNLECIGIRIAQDGLSYLRFLLDQLANETYPIPGNPMEAIQVMGILETRNLSFDTVIIPDMNEGLLPWRSEKDLFLNTQIRKAVGLPTPFDREALSRYYFRRLIEGASRIYLSYVEHPKRGIRSRFIEELIFNELKRPGVDIEDLEREIAQGKVYMLSLFSKEEKKVPTIYPSLSKDSSDLERLRKLRFNPSMFTVYISCPYHFYLQYVLGIKPPRKIEEEITPLDIGQIIHLTLNEVYKRYKVWKMSIPELHNVIWKTMCKHFDYLQPGQGIVLDILREKLRHFVRNEYHEFSSGWCPRAEFLEYKIESFIDLGEERILLNGILDRLDERGSEFRLLDYKTGRQITQKECNIGEDFKAPQLPFYLYLLKLEGKFSYENCETLGIYDLKEKFEIKRPYLDFQKDPISYMRSFEKWLHDILKEIFSDRPWYKKVSSDCEYCPYQDMCNV